jgi:predicted DNA-binding WGR domain protein
VSIAGTEVTVRYGRVGSQGQNNVKSFADDAAAVRHADKLIQEKTGKGYLEVT